MAHDSLLHLLPRLGSSLLRHENSLLNLLLALAQDRSSTLDYVIDLAFQINRQDRKGGLFWCRFGCLVLLVLRLWFRVLVDIT
jgi:hypothetical protein